MENVGIIGDCDALLVVEIEPTRGGLWRTRRAALRAALSAIRCAALRDIKRSAEKSLVAAGAVKRESALASASAAACDVRTCIEAVSMSEPSGSLQRLHQYECRSTFHSSARRIWLGNSRA